LNVDAAEVKEIILVKAAETSKPINLPTGVNPVPSRNNWRQPWRRSETLEKK
jgi:hypothetical protein